MWSWVPIPVLAFFPRTIRFYLMLPLCFIDVTLDRQCRKALITVLWTSMQVATKKPTVWGTHKSSSTHFTLNVTEWKGCWVERNFFMADLYSGSSRIEKCLFSPDRVYMTEQNRGRSLPKSLSFRSLAAVDVTLSSCISESLEFLALLAAAAQVQLGEGPCTKCNFLHFVSLESVPLFISLF